MKIVWNVFEVSLLLSSAISTLYLLVSKHLFGFFLFLSNNSQKMDNMKAGIETVNPCIFTTACKKEDAASSFRWKSENLGQRHSRLLGLILDRRLTFNAHLKKLTTSLLSRLRIIWTTAHTSWGWHHSTLKIAFQTLICSKLDYAAPAWQELMTLIWDVDPVSHVLPHTRLITLSTSMD